MSSEDALPPLTVGLGNKTWGDLLHTTSKPCVSTQQTEHVLKTLWMKGPDTQGGLLVEGQAITHRGTERNKTKCLTNKATVLKLRPQQLKPQKPMSRKSPLPSEWS